MDGRNASLSAGAGEEEKKFAMLQSASERARHGTDTVRRCSADCMGAARCTTAVASLAFSERRPTIYS